MKTTGHRLRIQDTKGVKALNDFKCPYCEFWTATERNKGILKCSNCNEKFEMG